MSILAEQLSLWSVGLRWGGVDSRCPKLYVPSSAKNHYSNLMQAILSAELFCKSISLEKRDFAYDERKYSIYYWLDDIYACIEGRKFNRALLSWAIIDRYDFLDWCKGMGIDPLPEFWFPKGWNLEFEWPEDQLLPGHRYRLKSFTKPQRDDYLALDRRTKGSMPESESTSLRVNQGVRLACRQIASAIWNKEPDRTIASVVNDPLIQEYGGGASYAEDTIRGWIKDVAPLEVRRRVGRPPKKSP